MARGRFTSAYPERMMLVDAVREVTRHVDPKYPETVSAPAFNAARAEAGHPDCPTAKQCAARLDRPWSRLRVQASDPGTHWSHQLRRRPETGFTGTATEVSYEVRRIHAGVAGRLGHDPLDHVLRELDWHAEVELLNRRRRRQNPMACSPSFNQVVDAFDGSLDELLDAHDLPTKPTDALRSLTVFQALDRFLETFGTVPRCSEFEAFCRAGRLRVAVRTDDWETTCAAWRAERAQRGAETPEDAPPKADRPNYALPDGFVYGDSTVSSRQPTQEECMESAVEFLGDLNGRVANDVSYRQWSVGHDNRASVNSLKNSRLGFHGTLAAARARLRGERFSDHPVLELLHRDHGGLARAVLAALQEHRSRTPSEIAEELLTGSSSIVPLLRRLEAAGAVTEVPRIGDYRTDRLRFAVTEQLPAELHRELDQRGEQIIESFKATRRAARNSLHPKSEIVLDAVHRLDSGEGVRTQQLVVEVDLPPQHVRNHIRLLKDRGVLTRRKVAITGERWREVWVYSLAEAVNIEDCPG